MKRAQKLSHTLARRLLVVQLLQKNETASNVELQAAYGAHLMNTQHMGLLRQAVKRGILHPERYSLPKLTELLEEAAPVRLRSLPSAVDKLAGLKHFLDDVVLPGMLPFTVGSEVQTVVITVTTDASGNPTLSRKIGKAVMEWDENTLDTRADAAQG